MDELDAFLDSKPAAPSASGTDALDTFLDSPEPAPALAADEKTWSGTLKAAAKSGAVGGLQTLMEIIDPTPMWGYERIDTSLKPNFTKDKEAAAQIIDESRSRYRNGLAGQATGYITEAATNPLNYLLGAGSKVKGATETVASLGSRLVNSGIRGAGQGFATGVGKDDSRFGNTVVGGVTGGVAQAGGEVLKATGKAAGAVKSAARAATKIDDVAARELASQGVDVSQATAGSDFVKNYMRGHLTGSTFGGKNIRAAAGRVEGQIDDALDKIIRKTGREANDPTSGGELVRGALETAKTKFYDTAEQLYSRFEKLVDPQAKADAKNVLGLVDDLKSEFADTSSSQAVRGISSEADEVLRDVVNAVNQDSKSGNLSLGLMLQLRKDIGSKIKDVPFGDARQGALKRLYGAVSRDIEGVLNNDTMNVYWNKANMPQKPGVLAAWKDANRFYARGLAEVKAMERKFGSSKSAEQVFGAVMGATKADTANLTRMFNSMTPASRDALKATVLRKMSIPGGGNDFTQGTVKTFVGNWNKLSPVSKKLLGADAAEVDKLARNYERVAPLINALPENGMRAGATVGDISAALATAGGILNPVGFLMGGLKFGGDAVLSRLIAKPALLKAVNVAAASGEPSVVANAMRTVAKSLPTQSVRQQFQALADEAEKISRSPQPKAGKGVRLNARPEATAAALTLGGGLGAANFASSLATNTQYGAPPNRTEQQAYERAATLTPDTAEPLPDTPPQSATPEETVQPVSEEASPISQTLVDRIVGIESGGRHDAKNPRSSATGAGQFINSTWLGMVEKYRPELMMGRSKAEILKLRNDPYVSRDMVQKYAEENASRLEAAGIPLSDSMIYLSHFLDGKNAVRLAKADPSTPAIRIVGKEAVQANPFLRGKRVADVIAWAQRKTRG